MTQPEYDAWLEYCIVEYAKDKMESLGISEAEALDLSKTSFERLLPDGLNTPDNYLFSVADSENLVGNLWFKISTDRGITTAFIYDIEMKPEFRGQGYGKATMQLIEPEARKYGATKIALHVFGGNETALKLYERSGYRVTDVSMSKDI